MKKIIYLLILFPLIAFSQIEGKTITKVFDVKDKSSKEIYSAINKWVALNYNSAQNVIQMNDKEAGTLIVKGVSTVYVDNLFKIASKSKESSPDQYYLTVNHTLEINTKDNRFRLKYTYTDLDAATKNNPNNMYNVFFWENIYFGDDNKVSEDYTTFANKYLKSLLYGKKRRNKIINNLPKIIKSVEDNMVKSAELTFNSIKQSLNSSTDW